MSVFQRFYDSEINFEVSGSYDAGLDVRLGDAVNGFVAQGKVEHGRLLKLGCATKRWRFSRTANLHRTSCERRKPTRRTRQAHRRAAICTVSDRRRIIFARDTERRPGRRIVFTSSFCAP
jgi:hypothetical protein